MLAPRDPDPQPAAFRGLSFDTKTMSSPLPRTRQRTRWRRLRTLAAAGALLGLLDKFIGRELPEALAQAHTFIETGGHGAAAKLARLLAVEEARWTQSADSAGREALQMQIAATRQRLAQTRHANESR